MHLQPSWSWFGKWKVPCCTITLFHFIHHMYRIASVLCYNWQLRLDVKLHLTIQSLFIKPLMQAVSTRNWQWVESVLVFLLQGLCLVLLLFSFLFFLFTLQTISHSLWDCSTLLIFGTKPRNWASASIKWVTFWLKVWTYFVHKSFELEHTLNQVDYYCRLIFMFL